MVGRNGPIETYVLPEDRKIWSVEVDLQKITITTTDFDFSIVSEGRIDFFDGSQWYSFDPYFNGGRAFGPLFSILEKDIQAVETCDGVLTLKLQDEMLLKFEPDPKYETWHIRSPEGTFDSSPSGNGQ